MGLSTLYQRQDVGLHVELYESLHKSTTRLSCAYPWLSGLPVLENDTFKEYIFLNSREMRWIRCWRLQPNYESIFQQPLYPRDGEKGL